MDDLISRQTAQRLFANALTYQERIGRYKWTTAEAKQWIADFIEDLPSVQSEIIRCKDCLMHGVCRFEQRLGLDGYCSQAERREE